MITRLVVPTARILLTLLFIAAAIVAVIAVWHHYEVEPWTRDGKVSADVVEVSADVSGLVTQVLVHDNQIVKAGQVLFVVDRERFAAQLAQSDAAVAKARATLADAEREARRYSVLGDLVSAELRDQKRTAAQEDAAALEQAQADRRVAAINLARAEVRARVNGYVTGFGLRPGDYVTAGSGKFALVDTDSYYVLGYLEENKLHRFAIGDQAVVTLLGDTRPIHGHVDSIAAGIADREQTATDSLLPNVTPTFSWIRLAQRVPVRIVIDRIPVGLRLVTGRTASVTILPDAPRIRPSAPASALPPGETNTTPQHRSPPIPAPR